EPGREVGDEMDDANTEGASAMASKLLERDVHLLREIDRALAKMAEGTYGLCEGTDEPIGYSRLRLRPWTRYSVEYQEELERAAAAARDPAGGPAPPSPRAPPLCPRARAGARRGRRAPSP